MRFLKNLLWLIIFSFSELISANTYATIDYKISPLINSNNVYAKIEVEITGALSDKIILDLPHAWAGVDYTDQVKNIEVRGLKHAFRLNKKKNKHQLILTIPSIDRLHFSYEIHQKKGDPSNVHEAIIRHDLIHAPGYGLFAIPHDLNRTHKIPFTITWHDLPKDWKTISDHGIFQTLKFSDEISQLLHGIYVAGNIRMYQIAEEAAPVYLSLYGQFEAPDKDIMTFLAKIIKSQRDFFKDSDFPYYAISLIEGNNPHSMGGTKLHNSFTAYLPKGMDQIQYYILFAHENLHNWIGGKIRNNYQGELNYWWTEGFTDYYTRLIAVRSGGITLQEFIDQCNEFLNHYYLSPVLNEPNVRIKKDFWKSYEIEKLPYYRGFVFAFYLNGLIKLNNPAHSLDNIIQDLFKTAKTHKFSMDYFQRLVKIYLPQGISNDIKNLIGKGETINLKLILSLLPLEKVQRGRNNLGFDQAFFIEKNIIKDIDEKSNAYKAGLRNGDKIIEISSPKGQMLDQIMTLKTLNKTFQFKPESLNKKDTYQLKSNLSENDIIKIKQFFDIKLMD